MSCPVKVAVCNLDQMALDFETNLRNIVESVRQARAAGCVFRSGPELEVCGYSCEDHFYEADTVFHCWESLSTILQSGLTEGALSSSSSSY